MPDEKYTRYPEADEARQPEPAVEAPSAPVEEPKKGPVVIAKEDRVELENFQLKLHNVQLQMQIMQADLAKALGTRDQLVAGMKKKRDELMQKYGIDIATVQINDDGTVVPLPQKR